MAATLSAGLSLRWLRDVIWQGTEPGRAAEYAEITEAASGAPPGAEGLFFLPYLAGERTPWMDAEARGGFIGLDLRHGRAHLTRAVMEGVVYALRQGLDLMLAQGLEPGLEPGIACERIAASGGGSRHPLWLSLQADIFNRPVYRTQTEEAAASGAALLAGVGTGVFPDLPTACRHFVRWEETPTLPDPQRASFYEDAYHSFCQLYPALQKAKRSTNYTKTP
jgi:xylulokinase